MYNVYAYTYKYKYIYGKVNNEVIEPKYNIHWCLIRFSFIKAIVVDIVITIVDISWIKGISVFHKSQSEMSLIWWHICRTNNAFAGRKVHFHKSNLTSYVNEKTHIYWHVWTDYLSHSSLLWMTSENFSTTIPYFAFHSMQ